MTPADERASGAHAGGANASDANAGAENVGGANVGGANAGGEKLGSANVGGASRGISLAAVIIDAADLEGESAFWHELLGGSIARTGTHHFLSVEGMPAIVVQLAPGHLAPQWPDGGDQQLNLDLMTSDVGDADRRVLEGGGRRLRPLKDVDGAAQQGGRVYASPAGHPFCLRPV